MATLRRRMGKWKVRVRRYVNKVIFNKFTNKLMQISGRRKWRENRERFYMKIYHKQTL